jgi:peptidoglycan hydrolase-like protein with peptidoglycan-binding domain
LSIQKNLNKTKNKNTRARPDGKSKKISRAGPNRKYPNNNEKMIRNFGQTNGIKSACHLDPSREILSPNAASELNDLVM